MLIGGFTDVGHDLQMIKSPTSNKGAGSALGFNGDIFKRLFCANVRLEDLAEVYGYDEEQVIELLEKPEGMTAEELTELEKLIG